MKTHLKSQLHLGAIEKTHEEKTWIKVKEEPKEINEIDGNDKGSKAVMMSEANKMFKNLHQDFSKLL